MKTFAKKYEAPVASCANRDEFRKLGFEMFDKIKSKQSTVAIQSDQRLCQIIDK